MPSRLQVAPLVFAIGFAFAATPSTSIAQNIVSSAISGRVVNASGAPVVGATVTIVDTQSGGTRVVTTAANGRYNAVGLRVGGPYKVTVSKTGVGTAERHGMLLLLGQTRAENFTLMTSAPIKTLAAVNVTANSQNQRFSPDTKGLSTAVSPQQAEAMPSVLRSIASIATLDPLVTVQRGSSAIRAAGIPSRFNSIDVDGISNSDPFGLNANGLGNLASPISVATIESYRISTANYNVNSDVLGVEVNAVTKSGTNHYHGSIYGAFNNPRSMVGSAGWLPAGDPNHDYHGYSKNWTGGFSLGGPIVKDKLFFFFNAERQLVTGVTSGGGSALNAALGSGPSTGTQISPGDVQRVIDIAKGYGMDPGGFGSTGGITRVDKRYLLKIDWNINNNHRLSLTTNYTSETLPFVLGDSGTSVGTTSYRYVSSVKERNVALQLFDNWTDNFSTHVKISVDRFDQLQTPPSQQPSVRVHVDGPSSPSVFTGGEQYRDLNFLGVDTDELYAAGTYFSGNHEINGGIDVKRNGYNDIFAPGIFGVYTFNSISDFASGQYRSYSLTVPTPGHTVNSMAQHWILYQFSAFIQDTWQLLPALSVQYGVRMNVPRATTRPETAPGDFEGTFGFPNNIQLGWRNKQIEPRVSFNYTFDTDRPMQLHGGIGLFQSMPPAVLIGNPYSDNGALSQTLVSQNPAAAPFSGNAHDQNRPTSTVQSGGTVAAVSRDFKFPSMWKTSLTLDAKLPWWGLIGSATLIHLAAEHQPVTEAINLGGPTGTLPDGRQQFWSLPGESPNVQSQVTAANANPAYATNSTLLTTTGRGHTNSLTLALQKPFSGSFSGTFSATFSHATEVQGVRGTSPYEDYEDAATVNPLSLEEGPAAGDIKRIFRLAVSWRHAFFGQYQTLLSASYTVHSGTPYSWVFRNDANGDGFANDLVYVPSVNDPRVTYVTANGLPAPAQVVQGFQSFVSGTPSLERDRGRIASLNAGGRMPWTHLLNVAFSQDIPGLFKGAKGTVRLDIFNFLNLLNRSWGRAYDLGPGPSRVALGSDNRGLVGYDGVNANGQYVYVLPTNQAGQYQAQPFLVRDAGAADVTDLASRWSALLTVTYTF